MSAIANSYHAITFRESRAIIVCRSYRGDTQMDSGNIRTYTTAPQAGAAGASPTPRDLRTCCARCRASRPNHVRRHSSATPAPPSASFKSLSICSSLKRARFMADLDMRNLQEGKHGKVLNLNWLTVGAVPSITTFRRGDSSGSCCASHRKCPTVPKICVPSAPPMSLYLWQYNARISEKASEA